MLRYLILAVSLAIATSCGNWVERYDLTPNRVVLVEIDPSKNAALTRQFRQFAADESLEIVIQNLNRHHENTFRVIMRNRKIRIDGTNMPTNLLHVALYAAVENEVRPTDDELDACVSLLIASIETVPGVRVVEVKQ